MNSNIVSLDKPKQSKKDNELIFADTTYNGKPISTLDNLAKLTTSLGITPSINLMNCEIELLKNDIPLKASAESKRSFLLSESAKAGLPKSTIDDHLAALAESNEYHPFKQYLSEGTWDGIPRVNPTLQHINAKQPDLAKAVLTKFLISVVAAVFEPRFSSKLVPVLQGGQSFRKTAFIRRFADMVDGGFLEGAELNPDNKDLVLTSIRSVIVELGELERTSRNNQGGLKAFITREVDTVRPPYGRTDIKKRRQTVFIATVNGTDFFRDDTGSTRYAVIELDKPIDLEGVNVLLGWRYDNGRLTLDKPEKLKQFWLEVKSLYDSGETWELTDLERDAVAQVNKVHDFKGNWYELLCDKFIEVDMTARNFEWMTATDVCGYCEISKSHVREVGKALKKLEGDDLIESKKGRANKTFYKLPMITKF
ncbi:VapE domain-containing protein [uncultured Vibrio sp.]|uniref:VapE domain-containing protein n=1 Tax=uncultured Vibrio sp. TaxID=114054 RepID=UPI0025D45076|nr:VapE domain-containing protein [uncultured Vibrio sp.]